MLPSAKVNNLQIYTLSHAVSMRHRAALRVLDASVFGAQSAWQDAEFDSPVPGKFEVSVIACVHERVAGFAIASRSDVESVHIHRIVVDHTYRNERVGRRLMDSVEDRATTMRASRVTLEFADSLNVAGFYKSLGYMRASTSEVRDYLERKSKQMQDDLYLPLKHAQRFVYLKSLICDKIGIAERISGTQD